MKTEVSRYQKRGNKYTAVILANKRTNCVSVPRQPRVKLAAGSHSAAFGRRACGKGFHQWRRGESRPRGLSSWLLLYWAVLVRLLSVGPQLPLIIPNRSDVVTNAGGFRPQFPSQDKSSAERLSTSPTTSSLLILCARGAADAAFIMNKDPIWAPSAMVAAKPSWNCSLLLIQQKKKKNCLYRGLNSVRFLK